MKRVLLIHFKASEASERLLRLRQAGHSAEFAEVQDFRSLAGIRASSPDAVVIDLGRLPSHGKEVGAALRQYAGTRHVPIVFIEGDPKKTPAVRSAIPDAVFTTWEEAGAAIEALGPVVSPAKRIAVAAGYSGTPLPKKLGIKAGSRVVAMAAPESFEGTLGVLPEGAELVRSGKPDVLIVFTNTQAELELRFPQAIGLASGTTRLWIAWPKKASGVRSDLNEDAVRNFGLGMGWVDYKVCAIDRIWSGLAFALRKNAIAR